MGVFGDSNEQFGTHEKLSLTSTIYVNCMQHDYIDLIYHFTLSKAFLIHIYIVSIWCMTSFTIHLASSMCLYILREKSLATYFEDSQLRRNWTFNFIVSKIYVDKSSRVR